MKTPKRFLKERLCFNSTVQNRENVDKDDLLGVHKTDTQTSGSIGEQTELYKVQKTDRQTQLHKVQ